MKPFLPPKAAPIMHGFLVSGLMSLIVTGIATLNAIGIGDPMFTTKWGGSWLQSWMVAFPVILFVAPLARSMVGRMVKNPEA